MTGRVFAAHEPLKMNGDGTISRIMDLEPAEHYGNLVFLVRWSDLKDITEEEVLSKFAKQLTTFDPSKDFILPIGSPFMIFVLGYILNFLGINEVNVLEWDRIDTCYNVRTINWRH